MMRWVLLALTVAGIYWLYQNGYYDTRPAKPRSAESPPPSAPLPPGGRPGGGLNPFVMDDGVDTPPQRPHVPSIPGH